MEGRRNYRDAEEMVQALSEFDKNPNTSMVDVAKNHSVGYHALYRRIRGEVDAKASSGKVQGLTNSERKGLRDFLLEMADLGLGYTRKDLKEAVMYLPCSG